MRQPSKNLSDDLAQTRPPETHKKTVPEALLRLTNQRKATMDDRQREAGQSQQ
jgi:hypothetical protein